MTEQEKKDILKKVDNRIKIAQHNVHGMEDHTWSYAWYKGEIEGYRRVSEIIEMMPCSEKIVRC